MIFRKLKDIDIENAYSIIEDRYYYLVNKGIKQYPFPYPCKDDYVKLQKEELNFGLYKDDSLLGIVTLIKNNNNTGWDINDDNFVWISSLYINLKYKNQSTGKLLLDNIVDFMYSFGIVNFYLDCNIDGNFLEKYYSEYGFYKLKEKFFKYPQIEFNAALMCLKSK